MKLQLLLKISVPKQFTNFSGKHLCWETTYNVIKKTLQHNCFPEKSLRKPFYTEQLSSGKWGYLAQI